MAAARRASSERHYVAEPVAPRPHAILTSRFGAANSDTALVGQWAFGDGFAGVTFRSSGTRSVAIANANIIARKASA
jgi:hypothetical protein